MISGCFNNLTTKRKVAVAMSGGVDSAVAMALLLKDPSIKDIIGLHMINWDNRQDDDDDDGRRKSCYEEDLKDANAVCCHLSRTANITIPLHKVSFASEYWTNVFEPYVEGIMMGQTPNPDISCNSMIKFGNMKSYAQKKLDANWIATGHYARLYYHHCNSNDVTATSIESSSRRTMEQEVEEITEKHDWLSKWGNESPLLLASVDKAKDQTYFLAGVKGESFRNVMFPLGELYKNANPNNNNTTNSTVRQFASNLNLPNANKKDSMGICFVGKRRSFKSFVSQYVSSVQPPGCFIDIESGAIVGRHDGAIYYTIGQGARISGASCKWYVIGRSNTNTNDILVCPGTNHPALYSDELTIKNTTMIWIGNDVDTMFPEPLQQQQQQQQHKSNRMHVQCRTGHLQPLIDSEICMMENKQNNSITKIIHVQFHHPIRAITPGQMAAFYLGDICLGGGIIHDVGPSYYDLGLKVNSCN